MSLKIAVLLKQVPDTETRVVVRPGEKSIVQDDVTFVTNPFDEYAMEEALLIRERLAGAGGAHITVLTLGPARATEVLRTGLALGADEAIHLRDEAFAAGDPLVTARALAAALRAGDYDLILAGKKAIDDEGAQVAGAVAEFLDLPMVAVVNKLEIDAAAKKAVAHREMDGFTQVVEVPLPAVITAQKGLNNPRLPSLMGIMKAKKKEIKVLEAKALGLGPEDLVGAIEIREMYVPAVKRANKLLTGDAAASAKELVRLLAEEAKVL